MARIMYCPFLVSDYKDKKGDLRIRCENASVEFSDQEEWKDFICLYCGSLDGWKNCTIAKSRWKHYEREEESGKGKRG